MNPLQRSWATTKRLWWLFPVCIVVGLALSTALTLTEKAAYSASSQVLITAGDGGSLSAGSAQNSTLNVADASLVAQSDTFFRSVAIRLGVPAEHLRTLVSVTSPTNTDAIQFSATEPSAAGAVRYANTIADTFATYYSGIIDGASGTTTKGQAAQVVAKAYVGTKTSVPALRNLAAGGFAGLVVALFAIGIIESTDRVIRLPAGVDAALQVRSVYLPKGDRPGRAESVKQLSRQIRLKRQGNATVAVGVLAAGGSVEGAEMVASLVADTFSDDGVIVKVHDTDPATARLNGQGGVDMSVTTLTELAATLERYGSAISLWLVVVMLGQSTEADVDQIRTTFADAGVDPSRVVGVALAKVAQPKFP